MTEVIRTQEEIDELESWAAERQEKGTISSGIAYEDGIRDTLDWLYGRRENGPHQDF